MANITIAEQFDMVSAFLTENGADQSLIDFIADRKAKSAKKSSSGKHKVTPAQQWLRSSIVMVLTNTPNLSVGEIISKLDMSDAPEGVKVSTSAVTANIGTMLMNGKTPNPEGFIFRTEEKGVAKFRLATEEDSIAESAE